MPLGERGRTSADGRWGVSGGWLAAARLSRPVLIGALAFGLLLGRPARSIWAGQDVCSEPNEAPAQACPIGSDSTAAGYLDSPDDVDRYSIQVGEGQVVEASLSTLPGDFNLRLESADGAQVAQGEGNGTSDKTFSTSGLPAGAYWVAVYSQNGDFSADAPYTLWVSVHGTAVVAVNAEPPAPPPAAVAERPLEQLVLIGDEAGEQAKRSGSKRGNDGGAAWYEVTFKRDSSLSKFGPIETVDRVYRAGDIGAAQRIYNAQAGVQAGLPETGVLKHDVFNLGPVPLPAPLGDQAQMVGACETRECSENRGRVTRHFRTAFQMGNLVHTLYTYGPDDGNNSNVAFDLAKRIEKRVNTAPTGPLAEIVSNHAPEQIGFHVPELGPEITAMFERTGSDARSRWYEANFQRSPETLTQRLGPMTIYNMVFVANSSADARAIFQENAINALPQATEKRGPIFPEPKTKPVGNDFHSIGACNDDCSGAQSEFLHERVVLRWGNVVAIIYTWGHESQSNPDDIGDRARILAERIP
jgi:hypothetical protein